MDPRLSVRLHIILATEGSTAIVIRRGPTRRGATFEWDRRDDTIRLGQWIKGKIYVDRCDLSPDGRHFVYFLMSDKPQPEGLRCWSAISRAPYLKALYFKPEIDTWGGGGVFVDNTKIFPYSYYDYGMKVEGFELLSEELVPEIFKTDGTFSRELRQGWSQLKGDLFEKQPKLGWELRNRIWASTFPNEPDKGIYNGKFVLRYQEESVAGEGWDWADWDPVRERLVWTLDGRLYGSPLRDDGLLQPALIHDFNPYEFKAVAAPY